VGGFSRFLTIFLIRQIESVITRGFLIQPVFSSAPQPGQHLAWRGTASPQTGQISGGENACGMETSDEISAVEPPNNSSGKFGGHVGHYHRHTF